MNRELKFKLWLPNIQKMSYAHALDEWRNMQVEQDNSTFVWLQYTGLKDTNGVEVYEGDVIKISYDTNFADKPFYIGSVRYGSEQGYPAFDLDPWIDCEMNALSWLNSESDESVKSYEVIGNIYQHPNLLEGTK